MNISRRLFVGIAGGVLLHAESRPLTFGFSLYGMKTLPWREGLAHIARIGYKAMELCLRPGWDTEAKLLGKADRGEIRKRIGDLGLALPSVMENLALGRPGGREANLERLRTSAEVCHKCSPAAPALIETTVGGRPDAWDQLKDAMAGELGAWEKKMEELNVTLAIKAHSKTAMTRPERALWLPDEANSPRIKLVYDSSHYAAFGLDPVGTRGSPAIAVSA